MAGSAGAAATATTPQVVGFSEVFPLTLLE